MMGVVFAAMCLRVLNGKGFKYEPFDQSGFSLMAFCLSVLSVPVFDTLRVMTMRMVRGRSPFSADRTHLHHMLMNRGLSAMMILFVEISISILVLLIDLLSLVLKFNLFLQLLTVIISSSVFLLVLLFMLRRNNG